MISGRKGDQIGIVFLGSKVSKSRQFDGRDEEEAEYRAYENVLDVNYSLAAGDVLANDALKNAGIDMLKVLHEAKCKSGKSSDSTGSGELLDAMVVAIKMILLNCTSAKTGQPLKFNKRIVLFSDAESNENGGCSWSDELLDPVVEQLQSNEISTLVCGFGFDMESLANHAADLESPLAILNRFINRNDGNGSFVPGPEALSLLETQKPQASSRPTATFRGNLVYGRPSVDGDYALEIPIHVYVKTSAVKLPSAKKIEVVKVQDGFLSSSTGTIERDTTFYRPVPPKEGSALDDVIEGDVEEVIGEPVDKEELVRAYRYGKHYIPFTDADEAACSISTFKVMEIISFTPSLNVPRHYFMSNVQAVVPDPSSKIANQKLGALAAAMAEKEHVAIVRYCRTDTGTSWKLGVLTTCAKGYFLFNQIPYSDDIRKLSFRPFDYLANEQVNSASGVTSACLPSKNRVSHSFSARKHILDARKVSKDKVMSNLHALIDVLDYTDDYTALWPKKVKHFRLESMNHAIIVKSLGDVADVDVLKVLNASKSQDEKAPQIPKDRKEKVDQVCKNLESFFDLVAVPAAKVGKSRVRKVVHLDAGSKDLVKEEDIDFSFLDDDEEEASNVAKGTSLTKPVVVKNELDKEFEFLDF